MSNILVLLKSIFHQKTSPAVGRGYTVRPRTGSHRTRLTREVLQIENGEPTYFDVYNDLIDPKQLVCVMIGHDYKQCIEARSRAESLFGRKARMVSLSADYLGGNGYVVHEDWFQCEALDLYVHIGEHNRYYPSELIGESTKIRLRSDYVFGVSHASRQICEAITSVIDINAMLGIEEGPHLQAEAFKKFTSPIKVNVVEGKVECIRFCSREESRTVRYTEHREDFVKIDAELREAFGNVENVIVWLDKKSDMYISTSDLVKIVHQKAIQAGYEMSEDAFSADEVFELGTARSFVFYSSFHMMETLLGR